MGVGLKRIFDTHHIDQHRIVFIILESDDEAIWFEAYTLVELHCWLICRMTVQTCARTVFYGCLEKFSSDTVPTMLFFDTEYDSTIVSYDGGVL